MTNRPKISESCVAIVGVGLIGGSIGAALKANGFTGEIIGCGRNADRLNAAKDAGLIDSVSTDAATIADRPSFWVFCTPVDKIVDGIRQAAAKSRPESIFTDAGSTKQLICEDVGTQLPNSAEFVGSHPLAGSEKNGFEFAAHDLYEDRLCVITPTESNSAAAVERVEQFWQGIGMRTLSTSPSDHDRLLATTSHLPHVAAAAMAALIDNKNHQFAATGFKDSTRVAGGDPELWTAILSRNNRHVVEAIQILKQRLTEFEHAVEANDESAIRALLASGQRGRQMLDDTPESK